MKPALFILLVSFCTATLAASDGDRIYQYTKQDGSVMFTNVKPQHTSYKTLKFDCYACEVNSSIDWNNTPLYRTKYQQEIKLASVKHKIDTALIQAIIHAESSFKPTVISKVGAVGLMQLMPKTAAELGVKNSLSAQQNILGGTHYLAKLLKDFKGNVRLATAAYNAGPSAVRRYNGVPPYPETIAYIDRVNILQARYATL